MQNFNIPLKTFSSKILPKIKARASSEKFYSAEPALESEEELKIPDIKIPDTGKKPRSDFDIEESDEEEEKETSALEIDEESFFASVKEDNKEDAKELMQDIIEFIGTLKKDKKSGPDFALPTTFE